MTDELNRYSKLIETIFFKYYKKGCRQVKFNREDLVETARKLKIEVPKNLGDITYSFRYRTALPDSIVKKAPKGLEWVIRPDGRAKYLFSLTSVSRIIPNKMLAETKIPDSTPGIIKKYSFTDEQSLLARIRYNRLIDIFTGITCYSLQNHLRTTVPKLGQIETDELYVGLDKKGVHYILPVQSKGGSDKLGIVQIEQDFAMCKEKFPKLICIPIAAQFVDDGSIALFSFEETVKGVSISSERHYRLVDPKNLTEDELTQYQKRTN